MFSVYTNLFLCPSKLCLCALLLLPTPPPPPPKKKKKQNKKNNNNNNLCSLFTYRLTKNPAFFPLILQKRCPFFKKTQGIMMQYDFCYPAKIISECSLSLFLSNSSILFPPNPWDGASIRLLCSKGNKCNNIFKGGKLIKINWCRNISFSTKLKMNPIKR